MSDRLVRIGYPAKCADNAVLDGAHYLRLPVFDPLELFLLFCFPPFFFVAEGPVSESLAESAAFWAGAFLAVFRFFVRGVDF